MCFLQYWELSGLSENFLLAGYVMLLVKNFAAMHQVFWEEMNIIKC